MRTANVYSSIELVVTLILEFGVSYIMVCGFDSKKNRSKLRDAVTFFIISLPVCYIKHLFSNDEVFRNICLITLILLCILYLHIFMQGSLWKKILFIALQEMSAFLAEIFIMFIFRDTFEKCSVGDVHIPEIMLLYILIGLSVDTFYLVVLLVWRRFVMKKAFRTRSILLFLPFPISQVMLISVCFEYVRIRSSGVTYYVLVGAVLSFLADAALMVTMINQQQMDDMRIHLMEMQNARLIEQKHYEEIENRREELAKIRHDLNEQFILMSELNERGDKDKVAEMLTRLTEYVASTREYQYCADPVVNAIMAENEKFCREKQITLTYELEIYRPLQIDPVTICSIFTNVLRNAITATDQTAGERKIMIRASVRGDYLHLIEENPYDAESHRRERKGYGLDILRSLTENLNGQMEIRRKDGGFRLELSVENRQTEQAV